MSRFSFSISAARFAAGVAMLVACYGLAALWLEPARQSVAASQLPDSADGVWHPVERAQLASKPAADVPARALTLTLDAEALTRALRTATRESGDSLAQSKTFLQLPLPSGEYLNFRLEESPVLDAELSKRFPDIKSYRGAATDNSAITMRADWTPQGFHALILTAQRTYSIHPVNQSTTREYVSYDAGEAAQASEESFTCLTQDSQDAQVGKTALAGKFASLGPSRRDYRLAIATTAEYSANYGGGTVAGTVASLNTWVNGLNAIYERDLNIHFNLVNDQDTWYCAELGFNSGNDPFTNGNPLAMLSEGRPVFRDRVGQANYDIGHTLGYVSGGGGGVAWLSVVCNNTEIFTSSGPDGLGPRKGGGISNISGTAGNSGYLNVIAHELGHQFGAPHSFNGTNSNCGGGNLSTSSNAEPGSGVSVMSYAGLCGSDNVSSGSNLRFHAWSFAQINNYVTNGTGNSCATSFNTGNNAPVISGGSDYTIPRLTPFQLTGTGTDPDAADVPNLTYIWEQVDIGGTLNNPPYTDQNDAANSTRPLFRSYAPTATPVRTVPALNYILNYANTPPATLNGFQTAEFLSYVSRPLTFRLLARDQRGGVSDDEVVLTVNASAGPFLVTAPNTAVTWTGGTAQTISWSVNNTHLAPINCANVRILLSIDGGTTFPITLANSTANDGSETVAIPSGLNTTQARIRVEAVGNIFFDISDTNFTVLPGSTCQVVTGMSPSSGAIGATVTLTGINFTNVSSVRFTSNVNASFTVVSDTQMNVVVPAGATSGPLTISRPNCADLQTASFTVLCPTLVLAPATAPNGNVGVAYNQTFTASGGSSPYSFVLASGALPNGLTLSSAGVLSGTPTLDDTFSFTLRATDAGGCASTQNFAVTISPNPNCPAITLAPTSLTTMALQVGQTFSQTFTASGGSGAYTYSLRSGTLPPGLTLSSSGVLSGQFTQGGTYNFTVRATAANGCPGMRAYSLYVFGCPAGGCGTLTGNPQPLPLCNGATAGTITLNWTAPAGVTNTELRIGSPTGTLFAVGGATGSATTGNWVSQGLQFFLINITGGASTPIAMLTAATTTSGCASASGTLTAATNPIQVCDGSGLGVATLNWTTTGVSAVQIRIGSPTGTQLWPTSPSGSVTTGKWVYSGTQFYLLDAATGATLATTTVTLTTNGCSGGGGTATGTLTASPNPIQVCDGSGLGVTTLNWTTTGVSAVQIRIGSPTGTQLWPTSPSGSVTTGKWVYSGTQFYLLNAATGATLATATVTLTTSGCSTATGTLSASPNPIQVCDGSGLGATTLTWTTTGVSAVQIRIGSPTGVQLWPTSPNGSVTTGKWVYSGTQFYLLNAATGATLATSTVTVVNTGCASNTNVSTAIAKPRRL